MGDPCTRSVKVSPAERAQVAAVLPRRTVAAPEALFDRRLVIRSRHDGERAALRVDTRRDEILEQQEAHRRCEPG
jgi:hypothetical protein